MRKSRLRALQKKFEYETGHRPHGMREVGTVDGYTAYVPSEKRRMKKEFLKENLNA